jgi:hypothetical protein
MTIAVIGDAELELTVRVGIDVASGLMDVFEGRAEIEGACMPHF